MDFINQYEINKFSRSTTTFTKPVSGVSETRLNDSGSIQSMGGGFIILAAGASGVLPASLRLYSDETSMITDNTRAFLDFDIDDSVALVADIYFDDVNSLKFIPPIIGNTTSGGQLWYNLSGSLGPVTVQVTSQAIRPIGDSTTGNEVLTITQAGVPTGTRVSGNITSPKSFLILSGSATRESRLRLYSRPISEVPASETSRTFGTAPNSGSLLIADLVFDTAAFTYPLVPILEAYTWTSTKYEEGNNQVGYYLDNLGTTGDITVTLHVYSTED
jgi:hypothetical protein